MVGHFWLAYSSPSGYSIFGFYHHFLSYSMQWKWWASDLLVCKRGMLKNSNFFNYFGIPASWYFPPCAVSLLAGELGRGCQSLCHMKKKELLPLRWNTYFNQIWDMIFFKKKYFEACFVVLINATRVFILFSMQIILIHSQWPFLVQISYTCLFKQMGLCKMSFPKDRAYNWKLAHSHLSGLCENTNVDPEFFIYKI